MMGGETPQVEHIQDALTVPSAQKTRPSLAHELDIPPWLEQQPGQAAVASKEAIDKMSTSSEKRYFIACLLNGAV